MPESRILVIEDNLDNLDLVCFVLERAGYKTLRAMDGKSGLELANDEKPDLILLDLTIPEIDGWHLALKEDPQTKHIPVIALTAHILPGDRKKAFDSGCDGYFSKPLDMANFLPRIESFLKNRGQQS
jgi:two-component system cell cycle response regulator DivK